MQNMFTEGQKKQFSDNIARALQQQGSILQKIVRNESMDYEVKYFDEVDKMTTDERQRNDSSGYQIGELTKAQMGNLIPKIKRRQLTAYIGRTRAVIDQGDNLNVLLDPSSMRVKSAAWAMGREYDRRIIKALGGTMKTGVDGSGSAPFNGNQVFNAQGKLNLNTLLKVRAQLRKHCFDKNEKLYLIVTEQQISDMLELTQATSSDYHNIKNLMSGDVSTFAGFNIITTEMLPVSIDGKSKTKAVRDCFAFTESSMIFGKVKNSLISRIETLPLHDMASLIYVSESFGAMRLHDKGVVCIKVDEAQSDDHQYSEIAITATTDNGFSKALVKPAMELTEADLKLKDN
jgi:hypothetical protein